MQQMIDGLIALLLILILGLFAYAVFQGIFNYLFKLIALSAVVSMVVLLSGLFLYTFGTLLTKGLAWTLK